jgi:hypothetical protein
MDSNQVISACSSKIKHILAERNERDEATINRIMQTKRVGWFWNRKNRTREQAIEWLLNDNLDHMFGWQSGFGWRNLEHLSKLLLLAEHGNPVVLNEEDTQVLFG